MAEEEKEQHYGPMQTVKRRFFAMRNGVIADVLRKGGSPFRTIFGLNLPQIAEIAADTGKLPDNNIIHATITVPILLLRCFCFMFYRLFPILFFIF